jgi:transcriptional regulator with XRE-family HTH domain
VAAEAANISRITLHRIERGEISVAMGAYLNVILALGLKIELGLPNRKTKKQSSLPQKIQLKDFKQLKKLGWQLKSTVVLSPKEALELYERNWRHVDIKSMDAKEKKFLKNLLAHFGRERMLV